MKRPLPLWLAVVLPSTIAGHALAYAFSGRTVSDGHHTWLVPVLEGSLALVLAVATWLFGGALVRARIVAHGLAQRHALALWPRLAVLQVALFFTIERAEGAPISVLGALAQLLVALLAACIVTRFARLLAACARGTEEAARYLERLFNQHSVFVRRAPSAAAFALTVSARSRRFGRAPPSSSYR